MLATMCEGDVFAACGQPGTLRFPSDFGSHPAFSVEWWYITGWLRDERGRPFGMQVTFFRTRPAVQEDNPSAFAPKQLLFAHGALGDLEVGRLQHDQRAARAGFGLAAAAEHTTDVRVDDWSLVLQGGRYIASVPARTFALSLHFSPTQPLLLEGQRGFSRKGPRAEEWSCYYSQPHLDVSGSVTSRGRSHRVIGMAWLDHEWSNNYLAKEAPGWDWTGINFDDGSALMAFRIRARDGTNYWASATYREPGKDPVTLPPLAVHFEPLRNWRSPHTGASYPVAMRLRVGERELELQPLMDDQELDSRASVGAVYWEGAVEVKERGRVVGRGYLELTGYVNALKL